MSKPRVFIDGQQGSTGLRINALLARRADLELVRVEEDRRKDPVARAKCLNDADFAVLCLPDAASAEAVEMVGDGDTRLIDTSTARRLEAGWTYGLPELSSEQRSAIRGSRRVANPGCYPQTFILAIRPLIEAGLVSPDAAFTVNAVSGYSGGGRAMVEDYQEAVRTKSGDAAMAFCLYGLDGIHKHLPEMQAYSLVEQPPLFVPSIDHSFCGMLVNVPLPGQILQGRPAADVYQTLRDRYRSEPLLNVFGPSESKTCLRDTKFLDLTARADSNCLDLLVFDRGEAGTLVVGRLDNLGKGAAGNAVQCLNIMLGIDESTGLKDARIAS